MNKPLFIESLENHQRLIDILLTRKNEKGICVISEEEIIGNIKHNSSWIKRAISRINTEDLCIELVAPNQYIVHYENLLEKGVFNVIFKMILYTVEDLNMLERKNLELMKEFKCNLKTVQMYRSYCTTGWIRGTTDLK